MAAVLKLSDDQVAAICLEAAALSGAPVQVANYNSPGQVVISGAPTAVAAAGEKSRACGGRIMPLAVSVAAHSSLMAPAAEGFSAHLAQTEFLAPEVPVYGNVHAQPLLSPEEIRPSCWRS